MKVSEVIDRVKRIEVIVDVFDVEDLKHIHQNVIDDIVELLDEYKDELLNKVVK